MTTLLEAAQQALEALEQSETFVGHEGFGITRRKAESNHQAAIIALRAALIREDEASAWLAERKEHWRKEREKAQTTKDQDPELSAALGWPGGISNPVLDRTQLLQMVAALRVAAQQVLPTLGYYQLRQIEWDCASEAALAALRAALAQEQVEPDLSRCPQCNGPADNGFDRSIPPSPYLCTQCMAEPGTWVASPDGRVIYDDISKDDCLLRVSGDFEDDEQRIRYTQRIVDALNAAPPRRTMVLLTEKEIVALVRPIVMADMPDEMTDYEIARAVEKASWEKNNG